MNQNSPAPTTKITAATVALALAMILVYAFESASGVDLPATIEGAVLILCTFGAGYMTREV